jgi:two-component system response regulator VicR
MARILVVDDEAMIRDFVTLVLAASGHEVLSARDGIQGLQAFKESTPDILLTDIMMPGMDGLELLQEVFHSNSRPKIIAMSGDGAQGNILGRAEKLGADKTLAKPFTFGELTSAVKAVLGDV